MESPSQLIHHGAFVLIACLASLGYTPITQAQAPLACPPATQPKLPPQSSPHLALLNLKSAARQRDAQPLDFSGLAERGRLLLEIGRREEGLALLRQAEPLQEDVPPPARIAYLNDFGRALAEGAQFDQARQAFTQAASIALGQQRSLQAARSSINAIRAQIDAQDLADLEANIAQVSAELQRSDNTDQRTSLQVALSDLMFRGVQELGLGTGVEQAANDLLEKVVGSSNNPKTLGYAFGFLGRLKESQGDVAQGLKHTLTALQQAEIADSVSQVYRWEWQAAGMLREQGKPELALEALERAIFLLDEFGDAVVPRSRTAFATMVAPVYTEYADLLLAQAALEERSDLRQTQLRSARSLLESLKQAEIEDYFASRCLVSSTQVEEMSQPGSAVIYPVLLGNRLELLVEIDSQLHQFTVPVEQREFDRTIREFRLNLERPRSGNDYLLQAQQLYQWLIAPVLPTLNEAEVETLVLVPEGALRTVPISALHDGEEFLIETFAVATTPAVQLTRPSRPDTEMRFLAGGLTQGVQGFSELPNVAKEIDQLAEKFSLRELRDERFVTAEVSKGLASTEFSLVHLATHGEFKADYKQSFILTFDDRLTLGGLQAALSTRSGAPLDLLVLSACQTAAGDDRAALGLAGVAVQSGARSALASLWSISDASTADLFAVFYDQLRGSGRSKAQSLRQAQRALLAQTRYQHPSYWAAFLLIGDWN